MTRTIITLCGSTRFYEDFVDANYRETMAGRIVLSVGFFLHAQAEAHGEPVGWARPRGRCTYEEKLALDELHFDKIAMSDEILVLNVGGYVGESTRNEIALALMLNKAIRWLDTDKGGDAWLEREAHDIGRRMAVHFEAGRGRR